MKHTHYITLCLLCLASVYSCNKKIQSPHPPLSVEEVSGLYGSSSGKPLSVTSGGKTLPGLGVTVQMEDQQTVSLTVRATASSASEGLLAGLPLHGIVPGETETVLKGHVTGSSPDRLEFTGEETNGNRSISFRGSFSKERLALDITVVLKNVLAGKSFQVHPVLDAAEAKSDAPSGPVHVNWESAGKVTLMNGFLFPVRIHMQKFLARVLEFKIKSKTAPQMLADALEGITFGPDGHVTAHVRHAAESGGPALLPVTFARYYMQGDDHLFLLLDPAMVSLLSAGFGMKEGGEPDLALMRPGINVMLRSLAAGFPLKVMVAGEVTTLIIDTPEVRTHLKGILVPFLSEEKTLSALEAKVKGMASLAGLFDIRPLIQTFIEELDVATAMQVGLHLTSK